MARPRVFISSTYIDQRVLRADLERFIKEMGFEPVLFERGHIAYGKEEALEEYCFREISTCDILIAIIGGSFGTQAKDTKNSISHKELKTAIDLGKQIYIFVERSVLAEYKTYQQNKELEKFKPAAVNDKRIYQFLDEIYSLPAGNPVEPFELAQDITRYLREQWAGLFQRLLQENARQQEINIIENLKSTASTLNNLVTFLTEERTKGDSAIKDILLSTHPAFEAIKKVAQIQYRVVFYNLQELNALLAARAFEIDDFPFSDDKNFEWNNLKANLKIIVNKIIFDEEGNLKVMTPKEWCEDWVEVKTLKNASANEEDLPF